MKPVVKLIGGPTLVLAILLSAGCGSSSTGTAGTIVGPAIGSPPAAPPTYTPTADPIDQIRQWKSNGGDQTNTAIGQTTSRIKTVAANHDQTALLVECQMLSGEVTTARSLPVLPPSVQEPFTRALEHLDLGAKLCAQGAAGSGNATLLTQAAMEFDGAAATMNTTNAALQRIEGGTGGTGA